jgi:hypothetical protein
MRERSVAREALARLADARAVACEDVVRLGSLATAVACERAYYRNAVLAIFRTDPGRHLDVAARDARLVVFEADEADGVLCGAPPDELEVTTHEGGGRWTIATEALTAHLFNDVASARLVGDPPRAGLGSDAPLAGRAGAGPAIELYVAVRGRPADDFAFRVHLSVALHRALLLLERLYVHAAGVRLGDVGCVFVGDKGAGKSTLSLALGAAGATVLADDHVVLRRDGERFVASGCDGEARLLADAEQHLFGGPVDAPIVEHGGVRKKEIAVHRWFASDPYREHALDRVVFCRVGSAFRIDRLSKRAALTALIGATRSSHRFAGAADYGAYLDYLSDLVAAAGTFTLELSPDLSRLGLLAEWMRDGAP